MAFLIIWNICIILHRWSSNIETNFNGMQANHRCGYDKKSMQAKRDYYLKYHMLSIRMIIPTYSKISVNHQMWQLESFNIFQDFMMVSTDWFIARALTIWPWERQTPRRENSFYLCTFTTIRQYIMILRCPYKVNNKALERTSTYKTS